MTNKHEGRIRPNRRVEDIEPEDILDDEPVGISATCLMWATSIALVLWLMVWAVVVVVARYI